MIAKRIKFPLVAGFRILLPEGSEIQAASVTDDITFLECAVPWDPEGEEPPPVGAKFREHRIETYLEGECREIFPEEGNGDPVKVPIEVPKPSDILRILGTLKTVETPATWHVFERVNSPQS